MPKFNHILLATGIYPPEIGGPATYAVLLEKEMAKQGVKVNVLPFRTVRGLPPFIRHLAYLFKVANQGRKNDLIFVQDTLSSALPAVLASKLIGKPVVLRAPGDWVWEQSRQRFGIKDSIDDFQNRKYGWKIEFLRSLQRWTVSNAQIVITPSKYFSKIVSGWLSPESQVHTIYNGIDLSISKINANKYNNPTIITSGRLLPWKGVDKLLALIKLLPPDWNLVIVGDGPERVSLEQKTTELSLERRVRFLGELTQNKLFEEISKSDIFILNTSFESFSFQLVEAMALGTPVITTNIGNLEEIIEHEKNGILVKPDDLVAMKYYVEKIKNHSAFRSGLIENAKNTAKSFSIEKTIAEVIGLINHLF